VPQLKIKDAEIHYEMTGSKSAPVLVFSNSLGTNLAMWDPQADALAKTFRVLRYDARGHGASSTTTGPYSIEQLANDVVALLDELEITRTSFCGLSMGGMIGMFLASRLGNRLDKLVLCNTAPKIGSTESWNARIETVCRGGMKGVVESVLERWYTPHFRSDSPTIVEWTRQMFLRTSPEGYCACCAAIRDMDLRPQIAAIRIPTLIVSGTHDPVTTVADAHLMAEQIQQAQQLELPSAHLSNIEAADAFTLGVSRFLMD
jgi:3-oxoadipate enol-lactonase